MKKISLLIIAMLSMVVTNALAGTRTFYYKAIATSVDEAKGKVFVSFYNTEEEAYAASVTTDVFTNTKYQAWGNASSNTATLYLYAKPEAGFKFVGWKTSESDETFASTDAAYTPTVTSKVYSATAEPATFNYIAVFEVATEFYSSKLTAISTIAEGGQVSVITDGEEQYDATSEASILNSGDTKHTYELNAKSLDEQHYRFVAWYSDEACENQISKTAAFKYSVTAESMDAENPTAFTVFAKFEKIPYYASKVVATADHNGKVLVTLANDEEGEFAATSENSQVIADKTSHTYYLKASCDYAKLQDAFAGWYADAEYTTLISDDVNYKYTVKVESIDADVPTLFNVYAKFQDVKYGYQIPNSDFEIWNTANNEPAPGWNSFPSAVGSLSGMKGSSPYPSKVEGRNGGSAVKLISKFAGLGILGANANGNLTTGIVNMGNMTPTDASNHNYTDINDKAHYVIINGQPDGVEFYAKYKMGDGAEHTGHAQFIIHDEVNYIDPEREEQAAHRIASSSVYIPVSEDWNKCEGTFNYDWSKEDADNTRKYILVNFTTNITPGGSKNDELILDDVRLIYNSELATAKFDGQDIIFTDGAASVDATYNAAKIELASNGRGAAIAQSFDNGSNVLTVTVTGQDIEENAENKHTYTITFAGQKVLKGDVNNDGIVNKADADLIIDHYLGKDVKINTDNADVNNDNKISVADANEIINK